MHKHHQAISSKCWCWYEISISTQNVKKAKVFIMCVSKHVETQANRLLVSLKRDNNTKSAYLVNTIYWPVPRLPWANHEVMCMHCWNPSEDQNESFLSITTESYFSDWIHSHFHILGGRKSLKHLNLTSRNMWEFTFEVSCPMHPTALCWQQALHINLRVRKSGSLNITWDMTLLFFLLNFVNTMNQI